MGAAQHEQRQALFGTGVGLRGPHVPYFLGDPAPVPWFELLTDNHLASSGPLAFQARAIAERYPVALHGVGMNLGGTDPLDLAYVDRVARLADALGAVHVSEHLAFTAHAGWHVHELLPVPRSEESLANLVERIDLVQSRLDVPFLVENISTYAEYADDALTEGEFLSGLVAQTGCRVLLDVNNLVVNATNHGGEPDESFATLPWHAVAEIHVAGHDVRDDLAIDTHDRPVPEAVLALLGQAIRNAPEAAVLVEWDRDLPSPETLLAEAERAEAVRRRAGADEV